MTTSAEHNFDSAYVLWREAEQVLITAGERVRICKEKIQRCKLDGGHEGGTLWADRLRLESQEKAEKVLVEIYEAHEAGLLKEREAYAHIDLYGAPMTAVEARCRSLPQMREAAERCLAVQREIILQCEKEVTNCKEACTKKRHEIVEMERLYQNGWGGYQPSLWHFEDALTDATKKFDLACEDVECKRTDAARKRDAFALAEAAEAALTD